jgi:hypothetical protein
VAALPEYPFVDLALSRRLERAEGATSRNLVDARASVSPEVGSCSIEVAGTLAMFDGVGSPMTQTFCLGMLEPASVESLEKIESFYRDRGSPVHHEVSPIADPTLIALLVARGYHPIELTSVMFRPISSLPEVATNPAIRVKPVQSGEDEPRYARTLAAGWSEYKELGSFVHDVARVQSAARGVHAFIAELNGESIAAGTLGVHDGVALLAGASTIPSARRQGAQLALLAARLRFAVDQGCDLAMMCALPGSGSQRNAERHGFRIAYTRIKWLLP